MRPFLGPTVLSLGLAFGVACVPDKRDQPEWRKPPKAWDPVGAEHLTFGKKGLDAFNTLSGEQRAAWVEDMKSKPGSFTGQAIYKMGTELGEKMDDFVLGNYEINTELLDPILYEITLSYTLFGTKELGETLNEPHSYIEFKGTLADLVFHAEAKPRKIDLKIKIDEVKVLKD